MAAINMSEILRFFCSTDWRSEGIGEWASVLEAWLQNRLRDSLKGTQVSRSSRCASTWTGWHWVSFCSYLWQQLKAPANHMGQGNQLWHLSLTYTSRSHTSNEGRHWFCRLPVLQPGSVAWGTKASFTVGVCSSLRRSGPQVAKWK